MHFFQSELYLGSSLIFYVLLMIGWWKLFEKAGEPGWKSLIPVYNLYTVFKICWKPSAFWISLIASALPVGFMAAAEYNGLFGFLTLLGIVPFVIRAIRCSKLASAYGHGTGFAVGLFFMEPIFVMILGYGASRYEEQLQAA